MTESGHVLILAGGQGLRLWPWSRPGRYKPFLPLCGDRSLLAATLERALSLVPPERIHLMGPSEVVTDIGPFNWIVESVARDTAPAIYQAAREIVETCPAATMLVFPADHRIEDAGLFRRGMRETLEELSEDPAQFWLHGTDSPLDSSYGYIVPSDGADTSEVSRFEEKPAPDRFDELNSSGALRNTGVFGFKAALLIDEYTRILGDSGGSRLAELEDVPSISIDHFLLEREDFLERLQVRRMVHGWSDLGSWPSLRSVFDSDSRGNVIIADPDRSPVVDAIDAGDPVLLRSQGIEIDSDGGRQILCLGLEDKQVRVSGNHVSILSPEMSSPEDGLVDCSGLLVFLKDDVRISICGISGGLVAVTTDVILVASEEEISSGGLREALEVLDQRSQGAVE